MGRLDFISKMSEEDAYLFKRCIRKLLDVTFIVADKDEKLKNELLKDLHMYGV